MLLSPEPGAMARAHNRLDSTTKAAVRRDRRCCESDCTADQAPHQDTHKNCKCPAQHRNKRGHVCVKVAVDRVNCKTGSCGRDPQADPRIQCGPQTTTPGQGGKINPPDVGTTREEQPDTMQKPPGARACQYIYGRRSKENRNMRACDKHVVPPPPPLHPGCTCAWPCCEKQHLRRVPFGR